MSGVFQDVHLSWGGQTFTISARKIMGAIAVIERHITLKELGSAARERETVPLSALASAWAAVLNYAGAADVSNEEIYRDMLGGGTAGDTIIPAIEGLMVMMIPPETLASAPAGNPNRRQRRKAAAAARSSQKHSS